MVEAAGVVISRACDTLPPSPAPTWPTSTHLHHTCNTQPTLQLPCTSNDSERLLRQLKTTPDAAELTIGRTGGQEAADSGGEIGRIINKKSDTRDARRAGGRPKHPPKATASQGHNTCTSRHKKQKRTKDEEITHLQL